MKSLFDEKFGHFELQNQRCEDLIKSYDKKIEDLDDALGGLGKQMKEIKELVQGYEREVKTLKKIVVCGGWIDVSVLLFCYVVMWQIEMNVFSSFGDDMFVGLLVFQGFNGLYYNLDYVRNLTFVMNLIYAIFLALL